MRESLRVTAYYNEHDPFAAAWLRELIKAGLIAPGIVDERSIEDVRPDELAEYAQCHFFAGIGGWSYALRLAGWPDDRSVWTGSCPCQPFSAAGKGDGFADERHLWPAWDWLIGECEPGVIFGEQVESAINHGWIDLVQTDLEAKGYAVGAVGLPACSVGAPHIRARAWFVAESDSRMRGQGRGARPGETDGGRAYGGLAGSSAVGELADRTGNGRREEREDTGRISARDRPEGRAAGLEPSGVLGELADTDGRNPSTERQQRSGEQRLLAAGSSGLAGFWSACDWLPCRDGKARPIEPGTFPLAHGVPARVGRLRGYGNAIVPQVAAEVILAYKEICA